MPKRRQPKPRRPLTDADRPWWIEPWLWQRMLATREAHRRWAAHSFDKKKARYLSGKKKGQDSTKP